MAAADGVVVALAVQLCFEVAVALAACQER